MNIKELNRLKNIQDTFLLNVFGNSSDIIATSHNNLLLEDVGFYRDSKYK